jgi:hypothetical protein
VRLLARSTSLQILWRPEEAWGALRAATPRWQRSLFGVAAPLSFLPAVGSASFGATFVLCLLAVLVSAAGIYALAPVFEATRNWDRSVAVAVYSAVPVLLASPLLFSAVLTIFVIVAFFHACFLCAIGLPPLLGCRGEDAAMYVAAVGFVSGLAGLVLGGLSSAAGIL